jgi:hypothetical protein
MIFDKPDPAQSALALVKASFYAQWQKTYGAENGAGKIHGPAALIHAARLMDEARGPHSGCRHPRPCRW